MEIAYWYIWDSKIKKRLICLGVKPKKQKNSNCNLLTETLNPSGIKVKTTKCILWAGIKVNDASITKQMQN